MFAIDIGQEVDGRWIAEVPEIPRVMVYGSSPEEAVAKAETLALSIVKDRLETRDAGASDEI